MDSNYYFADDIDVIGSSEYLETPNVHAGPGEDCEDAGYKVVNLLADDFALDLSELDLEGLN